MSENTDTGRQSLGRSIAPIAFGDNPDEIELDALDKARQFFGSDIALEIVRDYHVTEIPSGYSAFDAGGKSYRATVIVRERV